MTFPYDEFDEFYVFKATNNECYWNPNLAWAQDIELLKSNSMLSVTILPQIYAEVLGIDSTWVFKFLFPFLAVFIFLGLYRLYRTQGNKIDAFLATFFFISTVVSFGLGPNKQQVATFFYILLFLIIFNKSLTSAQRNILFIIFGASIVVSHYSMSYLFIFFDILYKHVERIDTFLLYVVYFNYLRHVKTFGLQSELNKFSNYLIFC